MATGFNTQCGDGKYRLQFETDNKKYHLLVQEVARRCVDGKPMANEELQHFLEFEIERSRGWQRDLLNPMYDGVCVGVKDARILRRAHIRFCERLLSMLNKEEK